MQYYNHGKKAELDFCKLVEKWGGATIVQDLNLQYHDVDVTLRDGRTVSVKDQHSADKFSCFLFEYSQERTCDGAKIRGNLLNCQANLYAIASPTTWFIFDAALLKKYILDNSKTFKFIRTTNAVEARNRELKGNMCYDRTWNYVVSYEALRKCGALLWEGKRI